MDKIILEEWYIRLIWVCAAISLVVYFKKDTPGWLKFFPPFLLLTVLTEFIGDVLRSKNINNIWVYNVYSLLEVLFYLLVLRANIENKAVKTIAAFSVGLYAIIKAGDLLLLKQTLFHSVIYNLGALLVLSFTFYYFFKLFERITYREALYLPSFWIFGGLAIYFAATIPVWLIYGRIIKVSNDAVYMAVQWNIFVNLILYSLFTIGFLCRFAVKKIPS